MDFDEFRNGGLAKLWDSSSEERNDERLRSQNHTGVIEYLTGHVRIHSANMRTESLGEHVNIRVLITSLTTR